MKLESSVNRRTFMKSAALLGGLSMLMGMVGRSSSAEAKQTATKQEKSGGGYRLTEHIKKYYETARL